MNDNLRTLLDQVRRGEVNALEAAQILDRMRAESPHTATSPAQAIPSAEATPRDAGSRVDYLIDAAVDLFGFDRTQLAPAEAFGRLGIDSRGLIEFLHRLERDFGPLPKTLLFEYPTFDRLAAFLARRGSPPRPAATEVPRPNPVAAPASRDDGIAIIGISGRYPRANDLDAFWQALTEGRNCIIEVPPERWDGRGLYDPEAGTPGKTCSRWGGFIDEVDRFDFELFGISPREAELMNPEERLVLETAWAALDDAGYGREALRRVRQRDDRAAIGVFVGAMYGQYSQLAADPEVADFLATSSYWAIANRVSNAFDLQGPSIAVDTACSSSLTAIHLACESLRNGECVMALAGGVNLSLHPSKYVSLSQLGLLATTAESRSLGDGDGLVPGEGVGVVVLKPLAAALRDRDAIRAVIAGSAASHAGTSSGFTAPSPGAMARMIRGMQERFGIDPATIGYIEAAATGAPLSDAIELAALREAFPPPTWGDRGCPIGSVKSNVGHLEAASGVCQLTKVILQLEHKVLVPTLHAGSDPGSGVHIQRVLSEWPEGNGPRRAAINSFGVGGSYAHLVVEEAPPTCARPAANECMGELIVLSARDATALDLLAARMQRVFARGSSALADIAFSLRGRDAMPHRLAFVARTCEEAASKLAAGDVSRGVAISSARLTPLSAALETGDDAERLRMLARVGEAWVGGAALDAAEPLREPLPHRVSLPPYPFARRRCWIQTSDARRSAAEVVATVAAVPDAQVESIVASLAAEMLGVPAIDVDEPFTRSGLTSIMAVRLIRSINHRLGLTLKTTALFDHATPRALARFVAQRRGAEKAPKVEIDDASAIRAIVLTSPCEAGDLSVGRATPNEPAPDEVRVNVHAFGLNFGDLLCAKGLYPTMPEYPFTPGFEVAGTIAAVGRDVVDWKIGDDVMALTGARFGGHAAEVCVPQSLLARKPENVSFEEAAAFPVAYLTVRHVFEVAQVRPGERILIQSAAGGLGLIGVQMAVQAGAEIFGTAGSEEKLSHLRAIGVHHAINYVADDFAERAHSLSNGAGIDVVINTLSGEAIQKGLDLLAPGGRYIEIAMTGLAMAKPLDLSKLVANQSFSSIDMRRLCARRPDLLERYLGQMSDDLASGRIRPAVGRVFDFDRVSDAYAYLEARHNIGKVVVRVGAEPSRARTAVARSARKPAIRREGAIAVIGMSGRFPGARDLDQFWDNLAAGRSSIAEVPRERWDWRQYFDPQRSQPGRTYCKWGGFLEDVDRFDPAFFQISGREAELTDPQQRLFLEECWKALEDAGYANERTSGSRCGVFVGCAAGDYAELLDHAKPAPQAFWGNAASVIASRISYFLDLRGPSIAVDTACSASLVAVHLACQSLRAGECEMALAGGVYVGVTPRLFLASSFAGMLAGDGRCKAFDDAADGFVPGEGVGVVALKPLDLALRDHDHIHGVIAASGVNQDGRTYGITAPSVQSQANLLHSVYADAEIDPRTLGYVEAHGTGTRLGDPIEVDALAQAFGGFTSERQFCAIGSVKTNIGHAATAAGIAGLIKVLLSIQRGQIAPSLDFETPNAHIRFEDGPFFVNTRLRDWPRQAQSTRRAAVSSFGFSGTNAHVVVEEYVGEQPRDAAGGPWLMLLSARDDERLDEMAGRLRAYVASCTELRIGDVAYTLQRGREAMEQRMAFVVESREDLLHGGSGVSRGRAARDAASQSKEVDELLACAGSRAALQRLGQLWTEGVSIDWRRLPQQRGCGIVPLPTYPFARERYWIDREAPAAEVQLLRPSWQPAAAQAGATRSEALVIDAGTDLDLALAGPLPRTIIVRWTGNDEAPIDERLRRGPLFVRALLQRLESIDGRLPVRVIWLMPRRSDPVAESIAGIGASIARVAPRLAVTVLRADVVDGDALVDLARGEASLPVPVAAEVQYANGVRLTRRLEPVTAKEGSNIAREGGVWLITGGFGGLGRLFARHLAETRRARLAIVGRSDHGDSGEAFLRELAALGSEAMFVRADVSHQDEVDAAVAAVRARYGAVHGVLHAAGARSEGSLIGKTDAEMMRTLAPKILGAVCLDLATRDDEIEAFVLFSSTSSILGDFGQADYAAANRSLDGFAAARTDAVVAGTRRGHTVSIGWPLWRDGGMRMPAEAETLHLGASGLAYLETRDGLDAFDRALESGEPHVIVMAGSAAALSRVRGRWESGVERPPMASLAPPEKIMEQESDILEEVRRVAGHVLHLSPTKLDLDENLANLGFDSICLHDLARELSESRGIDVPVALFFGEATLRGVARQLSPKVPAIDTPRPAPRSESEPQSGGVAIIGMSARFPGASSPAALWSLAETGRCAVTAVPYERLRLWGRERGEETQWGGFIDDIDCFDAAFFRISPREAELMDPQQRLFLEATIAAIEDAGRGPTALAGSRTGIFIGSERSDYAKLVQTAGLALDVHASSGLHPAILANRVSFALDFFGPSEVFNSGCASATLAIHRAMESLACGECDLAIAGGVGLMLDADVFTALGRLGGLGQSGCVRVFDAGADGSARAEGVGAIVLKRLSDATRDGDPIRAVLRGSAASHGGRGSSLTAPNPRAQTEAILRAWARAGIDPKTVGYIEGQGTATQLGDSIELEAYRSAFAAVSRTSPCAIGALKPNIGHSEAASGVAALIKVVGALETGTLPPLANFRSSAPSGAAPLYFPIAAESWSAHEGAPRRAGLHSYGFGGSCVHLVVEEAPAVSRLQTEQNGHELIVLSARDAERLRARVSQLLTFIEESETPPPLADIAFTLQTGRDAMQRRCAFIVPDIPSLKSALESYLLGRSIAPPSEQPELVATAARWLAGEQVKWPSTAGARRRVALPTYPFERQRHWIDTAPRQPESNLAMSVADTLRNLLAGQLKLPAQAIDGDVEFSDYGLDSVLRTGFMQLVQVAYGPVVPLSAVVDHPTLSKLTEVVSARLAAAAGARLSIRSNGSDQAELLSINPTGSHHPSFWIHGAPGLAQMYSKLSAALGPDYPFFAFQARGVDGKRQPFVTLDEMTSHYVDVMLEIQPEGPYFVGGYSYGGIVAFDVAQRLAARGKTVGQLMIIDTYPPDMLNQYPAVANPEVRKLQRVMGAVMFFADEKGVGLWDRISVDDLKRIPEQAQIAHIARLIKERIPTPLPIDHIYGFLSGVDTICTLSEQMARGYRLSQYDASGVLYFKTRELIDVESPFAVPGLNPEDVGFSAEAFQAIIDFDYLAIWREVIRGELRVTKFECDHLSLLEKPHVDVLAAQLRETLAS